MHQMERPLHAAFHFFLSTKPTFGTLAVYLTPLWSLSSRSSLAHQCHAQRIASAHLVSLHEAEQARMARVNQAWPKYLVIWGLMAVVGLLLRFATASDFWQGLGIALVFFGGVGLMVDGFAERRTHPYVDALQRGLLATPASP